MMHDRPVFWRGARALALLPLVGALLACSSTPSADAQAVAKAFADYSGAMTAGDGAATWALVGPETRARYARIAADARAADADALGARPLIDQLLALLLRHGAGGVPADDAEAFASLIRQGAVNLARFGVTKVKVDGDRASAALVLEGHALPARVQFVRAGDGWQVEVTALFDLIEETLVKVPEQLEITPRAWIEQSVRDASADAPDDLWAVPGGP